MSTIGSGCQFASVVQCRHFGFIDNKILFPLTQVFTGYFPFVGVKI